VKARGRWKPGTEGALQLLRLLRVLKPSATDLPVFLRASGLLPLFEELGHLFREAGVFSIITAETGATWSKNLQWMIKTRVETERRVLLCAVDGLRENPEELGDALDRWRTAARIRSDGTGLTVDQMGEAQDLVGIAEAHGDFHEAIVNATARSRHRPLTDKQLDDYRMVVTDMLPGALAALAGAVLSDQGRTVSVGARNRHMFDQEAELRNYALHERLGRALLAGEGETAMKLAELHWSWGFIAADQLPAVRQARPPAESAAPTTTRRRGSR
jgi:hypothetical protein